jgi:soluble lytic murein transglycosylase
VHALKQHPKCAAKPPGASHLARSSIIQGEVHRLGERRRALWAGLLLLAAVSTIQAEPDPLEAPRDRFVEARTALLENRLEDYQTLAAQLRDYPLYPYLQFEELRNRLNRAGEEEISRFLKTYNGQPVADRLRQDWLYTLAGNQRWQLFLKYYRASTSASVDLQCYALQARLMTGRKHGVAEEALRLWLSGESRPKACDPPFNFLEDGGHLDEEHIWARIRLAMHANHPALAGYLAKRLPQQDQAWVKLWREANDQPSRALDDPRLRSDGPLVREIILHALRRIARFDAAQAHEKWPALRKTHAFDASDTARLQGYIAFAAATQHLPQAHAWLTALPAGADSERIREWRIRTAIEGHDWAAVRQHITDLPAQERNSDEWRYWLAYALQKTGQREEARVRFGQLAKDRSYHGFLAADALRWHYEMGDQPIACDADTLKTLYRRPGLVRAHELYRADLLSDARREWAYAIRNMNREELEAAAVLASQWGWHDRAILTVARSGNFDDLELRFPLDYLDSVHRHAGRNSLDAGHVFALIRQESAFNRDARSAAGAMGLMQLMPGTGRLTALRDGIPYAGAGTLLDVDTNIQLGTAYLRRMMDRFDGNPVLATAAYNAGPQRVERWLPESGSEQAEIWIAGIPFAETRNYVQRVFAYAAIYDWRMQRTIETLKRRMPPVYSTAHYASSSS